jgi:hypothetical protein
LPQLEALKIAKTAPCPIYYEWNLAQLETEPKDIGLLLVKRFVLLWVPEEVKLV